jgi:hypothetical protein
MDIDDLVNEYPELYKHPDPAYDGPQYSMQYGGGGFEISSSAYPIFKEFSENVKKVLNEEELKSFYVQQVKEKFGSLIVYYDFWEKPEYFHDGVEEAIKIVEEKYYDL